MKLNQQDHLPKQCVFSEFQMGAPTLFTGSPSTLRVEIVCPRHERRFADDSNGLAARCDLYWAPFKTLCSSAAVLVPGVAPSLGQAGNAW